MSNFYYNDAYMESTSYYDGENSWEGQCCENPPYSMPDHHEDLFTMNSMENSWDEQCYEVPQYDMHHHYEESLDMNSIKGMFRTILDDRKSMHESFIARFDRLEQSMIASSQRMLALTTSNMYGDEEFMEENVDMKVATQQQDQTNEENSPRRFMELEDDTVLQNEESSIGKEFEVKVDLKPLSSNPRYETSTIIENTLFEIKDFTMCDNELFENDLLHVDNIQVSKSFEWESYTSYENELFELEGFTLIDNGMFEVDLMHVDTINPSIEFILSTNNEGENHELYDSIDISLDPFIEKPCASEETNLEDYFGNWTFELNEILEQSVLIKLVGSVEDPFFITLPQDKFRSFEPYISRSIERSSSNPLISKGVYCKKGLNIQRKVHCRLDGREVKWDLKVD